jgi:hypothetical protein
MAGVGASKAMPYTISGIGVGPVMSSKADLVGAARTASKMIDQGVRDVRVYDGGGTEVLRPEWEKAWRDWARTTLPKTP